MFLAVPPMIFIAASTFFVFKSGNFVSAISRNCDCVILPTFVVFGLPEPFEIPAALTIRVDAGGVFKINV